MTRRHTHVQWVPDGRGGWRKRKAKTHKHRFNPCTHVLVPPKPRKASPATPADREPLPVEPPAPRPGTIPVPPVSTPVLPPAPTDPPPGTTPTPTPTPTPPPADPIAGLAVYDGPWDRARAERLLWRAGLGPRPGDVDRFVALGLQGAVHALTRPGAQQLTGPAPVDELGAPLRPCVEWGHDHVAWLDRMVRCEHPLLERMALVWHDWFATSSADVNPWTLMLGHVAKLREHALGSFPALLEALTVDPAMLLWLDGVDNRVGKPNENYARECMELFCLGADRGAYTEADVRELARALTGWRADWVTPTGFTNFRFDPARADTRSKTLWAGTPHARTGTFDWRDACRLLVEHPQHAGWFATRLWRAFVPTEPHPDTVRALAALYVAGGHQVRPVLEAILVHPDLHAGPRMTVPPAVHTAGMLRLVRPRVDATHWGWLAEQSGQHLMWPPNVAGWDEARWLDTSTLRGRWYLAVYALAPVSVPAWPEPGQPVHPADETPEQALDAALAFWQWPSLSAGTRARLLRYARDVAPADLPVWERSSRRAQRQNLLRQLIAVSPDLLTC